MPRDQSPPKPIGLYARIYGTGQKEDHTRKINGVGSTSRSIGPEPMSWCSQTTTYLSSGRQRLVPGYEALRQAIRREDIDGLWTVEQSRLTRLEIEWFGLAADLVKAGIDEVHTRRDGIVRVGDDVAGIKAVLSAGGLRRLKKRVRDKHAELAAEGRPSGPPRFWLPPGERRAGPVNLRY